MGGLEALEFPSKLAPTPAPWPLLLFLVFLSCSQVDLSYKKIISQFLSAKKHLLPALEAVLSLLASLPLALPSLVGFCIVCPIVCSMCLWLSPVEFCNPWRRGHGSPNAPRIDVLYVISMPLCPHSFVPAWCYNAAEALHIITELASVQKSKIPKQILHVQLCAIQGLSAGKFFMWKRNDTKDI